MMDQDTFARWLAHLHLPAATQTLITETRQADPVRRTEGRHGNVRGRYPSRKMGVTIQFESHKVELWAIYAMEHDPLVLEYYDQPNRIKIEYIGPSGRRVPNWHPPDFLVLRPDGVVWEEWKPEAELARLVVRHPARYERTPAGGYRCPPGEHYARALGLDYWVRSSAELPPLYIQNLMFLEDYWVTPLVVPDEVAQPIVDAVAADPGVRFAAMLHLTTPHILYALIAQERLACDLTRAALGDHAAVHLYPNAAAVPPPRPGAQRSPVPVQHTAVYWDGQAYLLVGQDEQHVLLQADYGAPIPLAPTLFRQLLSDGAIHILTPNDPQPSDPRVRQRLAQASPADMAVALERIVAVHGYLHGVKSAYASVPSRTLRRWVMAFHAAEAAYGSGNIGLLPRTAERGNRTPRADSRTRQLMDDVIEERGRDPRRRNGVDLYLTYQSTCATHGIAPLTQRTFYRRLKALATPDLVAARLGTRVATATAPPYWSLEPTTPRHGDRPLALAHLDHTLLDIELVSQLGQNLGRPWLTLLMDAYSRRILATYLTFDPPSYRSNMMALRICVRQHRRFPQAIVVDNGKDFESVYFDQLLARYGCVKKMRPPATPHFGSVIERLFGTTNTQFLSHLLGNTQATKVPRQLTKATEPRRLAVWTLSALAELLSEWANDIYDQTVHPALGQTPRDAFLKGLERTGERTQRIIAYDDDFLKATLPTTAKGTVQIQPGKGIKLFAHWYWNDVFAAPALAKAVVPIRYDPFDIGVAYVYVDHRWIECTSEFYTQLQGRSERELQLVTTELRQQGRRAPEQQRVTMARLIAFWQRAETEEALLLQQLRDQESRTVRDQLPPTVPLHHVPETTTEPITVSAIPDYEDYR
ncbi:MAG: DDE-type integrase/transposase/recombinase [Ktedonobacterales bacterium]|nr:DDE-type integrase/transposase/recombinase [Ktedonobacterales bacterium]